VDKAAAIVMGIRGGGLKVEVDGGDVDGGNVIGSGDVDGGDGVVICGDGALNKKR